MVDFTQGLKYLITPMVFKEPDMLTGSAWLGHIPFAFWIVEALRPKVFVELGVHTGSSYCAFCQAVQELHLTTSCYAVDTWEGDIHSGLYGEEVFQTLSAYHEPKYSAFSRLVRSTFDQALENFSEGSIDLLHIDGLHTYEAVKHDFTNWLPKLSERAVVILHDTNVWERDFGVWRVWEEISAKYPAFEFLHSYGLGVVGVGGQLPDPAAWLVQASTHAPGQVEGIRNFFGRLGEMIEDHWLNRELKALVASRETELKSRQEEFQTLQGEFQTLHKEFHTLKWAYQSLEHELAARDAKIASIYESISWRLTSPLRAVDRWLKIRQ